MTAPAAVPTPLAGGAPLRIQPRSFGPFTKGVVDRANAALGMTGALRYARGLAFSGALKLSVRPGTVLALTLQDDTRAVTEVQASTLASGGSLTALDDSTQTWTVNTFAGKTVELLTGPGAGQRAVILSNTATELVVAAWNDVPALAAAPTSATTYRIVTVTAAAAAITAVVQLTPFADAALAVGYSSVTSKCYLYQLAATMDGWYDSGGVLHAGALTPEPVGVLWSSMTTIPVVTVAEGLGVAYLAHADALDKNGLYWKSRTWDGTTLADWTANFGDGSGAVPIYFTCVRSFQQAVWGAGFGVGITPATAYRPELVRFSPPSFGALGAAPPASASDTITVGNRVRSQRERVVGMGSCPNALFLGAPYMVTRVTGYGRSSWYREILDESHGFVGPLCSASDGEYCYYWSRRGPMRVGLTGPPEPLWAVVIELVSKIVNPERIVCFRDEPRDLIVWLVDIGTGLRTRVAYDVQRGLFSAADDDLGLAMSCGAEIDPIVVPTTVTPVTYAPAGPPKNGVSATIGTTCATASWTAGDLAAQTEVWLQRVVDAAPTKLTTLPAGVQSYTFTGLSWDTSYQWTVRHVKNSLFSAYLGPLVFLTRPQSGPLLPPTALVVAAATQPPGIVVSWTNSGETNASTEVWWCPTPSDSQPALDAFQLGFTAPPGASNKGFQYTELLVGATGTYWAYVRAVRVGTDPSSPVTGPASVYVTVSPGP